MTILSKNNKNKKFKSFKRIGGIKNKMLASGMAQHGGVLSGGMLIEPENKIGKRVIVEETGKHQFKKGTILNYNSKTALLEVELDGEQEIILVNPYNLTLESESIITAVLLSSLLAKRLA